MAELSSALYAYQRQPLPSQDDGRLVRTLDAMLARRVRPVIARRLRPDDVEDVLSEIRIAFWRYRFSIRAEEVGRFIHAIAHRKLADALRGYYRDSAMRVSPAVGEGGELLDILPARDGDPQQAAEQRVWEALSACGLADGDLLTAYLLFLGLPKGEIAAALGISPNTVTNALKRCRAALSADGLRPARSADCGRGGDA